MIMAKYFTDYEDLVKEFHSTKNGHFKPKDFTFNSSKSVWWKCPNGDDHEWITKINHRTIGKTKCPFCSHRKLSITNSFLTLYPKMSKEWHPTKNGNLGPKDLIAGAKFKVWWKCIKDDKHIWEENVDYRVNQKKSCPFCSKRQGFLTSSNNLGFVHPTLIKYWNKRKNGKLTPFDIISGSDKKYWWVCPDNNKHEWLQSSYQVTKLAKICPFCHFRKLSPDNNLLVMYPEVAIEFNKKKNKGLLPEKILPNTMEKVWWTCKHNHQWKATVRHRVYRKQGCPSCTRQTSIPEIRIFTELMFIFKYIENRKKVDGVEIDIFMPSLSIGFEYDGSYFHKEKEIVDLKKNKLLKSKGIDIFRIRELPLQKLSENDILVSPNEITKDDINQLLFIILPKVNETEKIKINKYLNKSMFLNEKVFRKYLNYFPSPFPEKSVAHTHPNLVSMWHKKNLPLKPFNFTSGTKYKAWWQCPKIKDHVWEAKISTVSKGHGCPFCSGQKVGDDNNLYVKFPDIINQWHPKKNNNKNPLDYTWGSGKKVWWKCLKGDDHEWEAVIRHRTSNNSGCPFCSGNKISNDNNFGIKFPELAKEWHPTKNEKLTPYDVMPFTTKKVWWICPNNHAWQVSISKRTIRGQKCKICKM